jgi:hypothetical protein
MIDLTAVPIDISSHILNFRNLLNSSWPYLDALMESHDWDEDGSFVDDWIQMNWQFLIERELLGKGKYLAPLEWNNRITFHAERANYKVICEIPADLEMKDWILKSNNYEGEELLIIGFRSLKDISYGLYPPFDFAEVRSYDKNKTYIIPINCCRFLLKSISS